MSVVCAIILLVKKFTPAFELAVKQKLPTLSERSMVLSGAAEGNNAPVPRQV